MTHRNSWLLALVFVGTTSVCGCRLLDRERPVHYETVTASSKYDTEAAEREHERALKIVSRHLAGQPVNLAEAEVHLQKALVADVTYGPAHHTLGTVYMRERKFYLAAWEFEYAAKLMPDRFEPLYNLGQVYEMADKLDNALVYYEEALSKSPRNPGVLGNLARAQLKSGKTVDEVRPLLEELVFHDRRPEWIAWARDELGRSPVKQAAGSVERPDKTPAALPLPEQLPVKPAAPPSAEPPRLTPPPPEPPKPAADLHLSVAPPDVAPTSTPAVESPGWQPSLVR